MEVPSMMRIETQVPKKKVFKTLGMYYLQNSVLNSLELKEYILGDILLIR
jgi:hypothetical protein